MYPITVCPLKGVHIKLEGRLLRLSVYTLTYVECTIAIVHDYL